MKVYNKDGRICARWLGKIRNIGLRNALGVQTRAGIEYLTRGNRVPNMTITESAGLWSMDVGLGYGRFAYVSEELAKEDKAALLTIIAEAL